MDTIERRDARAALDEIQERLEPRRAHHWAIRRLDEMFAAGNAPAALPSGFLRGRLVALSPASSLDSLSRRVAHLWMPWLGKSFDLAAGRGVNVLAPSARLPLRALWPGYEPVVRPDGNLDVFPFRTYVARGALDTQIDVLKIDYDHDDNPERLVRNILDELVEIGPGTYLGKILYRMRGQYRQLGFFSLEA